MIAVSGHCSYYLRQKWYINLNNDRIHRNWTTFHNPIHEWCFHEALTVVAFHCLPWFEIIYQDQSISAKKRKQWSWYGAIGCGDERGRDLTNNMNLRTCISGINMPASSSSCLSSAAVWFTLPGTMPGKKIESPWTPPGPKGEDVAKRFRAGEEQFEEIVSWIKITCHKYSLVLNSLQYGISMIICSRAEKCSSTASSEAEESKMHWRREPIRAKTSCCLQWSTTLGKLWWFWWLYAELGSVCFFSRLYRHTDIQTYRHTDIQTCRRIDIQTYRHTDVQTYREPDRQRDKETNTHTYTHTQTE